MIEVQVQLDTPKQDGSTLRQHLEQFKKMSGKSDPRLEQALIPYSCQAIYTIFLKLRRTAGDRAITYLDLTAYRDLMRQEISPREVDAILTFDSTFMNQRSEQIKQIKQGANNG